jgi:hypothetical protein
MTKLKGELGLDHFEGRSFRVQRSSPSARRTDCATSIAFAA